MPPKINSYSFPKSLKQPVIATVKLSVPFKVPIDVPSIISVIFKTELDWINDCQRYGDFHSQFNSVFHDFTPPI
jgi:hypothetical protein